MIFSFPFEQNRFYDYAPPLETILYMLDTCVPCFYHLIDFSSGVGILKRNLAATAKPSYNIIDEGDGLYNLRTETTFKTTDLRFRVGEEFVEMTGDGRKITVCIYSFQFNPDF